MNRDRLGDDAIKINTRDRLLRAWENSMELVMDYQTYKQDIKDNDEVAKLFGQFADEEAMHASKLHDLLRNCQDRSIKP